VLIIVIYYAKVSKNFGEGASRLSLFCQAVKFINISVPSLRAKMPVLPHYPDKIKNSFPTFRLSGGASLYSCIWRISYRTRSAWAAAQNIERKPYTEHILGISKKERDIQWNTKGGLLFLLVSKEWWRLLWVVTSTRSLSQIWQQRQGKPS